MRWFLTAAICACGAVAPAASTASDEKRTVRTYTNDDLLRMRALRGETDGGSTAHSQPSAAAGSPSARASAADARGAASGEAYWRREAARHRLRIETLERGAAELGLKLAERERRPRSTHGRSNEAAAAKVEARVEADRARLAALRARIREEDMRFLDRARREGALPGWLR